MNIINLTPHDITETTTNTVFARSGIVARVATNAVEAGSANGIALYKTTYGEVQDLPEEKDGVMYIVSGLVLSACKTRKDLLAPGALVRDENGNPVGCRGFTVND